MSAEICVTVIEGKDLAVKDACGTSDPYVKLKLGTEKHKTKKIMKNLNPRWNEKFFLGNLAAATLQVTVWDWDRIGSDDYMGEVNIPIAEVMVLGEVNKWYPLVCGHDHQGEEVKGEISLRVQAMVQGDLQTGNLNAEELRRFALEKMASTTSLLPVNTNGAGPSEGGDALPPLPPRDDEDSGGYDAVPVPPSQPFNRAPAPAPAPSTGGGYLRPQPVPSPAPPFTAPAAGGYNPAPPPAPQRTPSMSSLNAGVAPPPPQVKPPGMAPPRRQPGSFIAPAAPPPRPPALPQAKALYAWTAENPGELASLAEGELVSVKNSSDASWWMVVDARGNEGYVASNYVQMV